MEAYSAPVGYVFSLNAGGRSGVFDVVAGDFSAELAADTLSGVYVGLADDPTATTKVLKRRFYLNVNAAWFGADKTGVSDSSAAINAALKLANGLDVVVDDGVFRLESTVFNEPSAFSESSEPVYRQRIGLIGSGTTKTIFDSRVANGPAIRIAGELTASVAKWTMFPVIKDFTITTKAAVKPVNSHGIVYNACRFGLTSRVYIESITGDGIRLEQELGIETDQPAFMRFENSFVRRIGGFGFHAKGENPPAVSAAYIDLDTCQLEQCDTGGMYIANITTVRFRNGAISTCGSVGEKGGITVEANGRNSQNLIIEESEIGNGCFPYIAELGGINGFYSKRNRYGTLAGENAPLVGLQFGTAGSNNNLFVSEDDYIAFSSSVTPFTMFKTVGNADKVRILRTQWFSFDAAGQDRYSFSADTQDVEITAENTVVVEGSRAVASSTVTDGTYTVDLLQGQYHRIAVGAGSALSIAPPAVAALVGNGKSLTFHITNGSGGALTPVFETGFVAGTVPELAANQRLTARFEKDPISGFVRIGEFGTL
jgi:hypothetical protein